VPSSLIEITCPELGSRSLGVKFGLATRVGDGFVAGLVEQLGLLGNHELDARHFIRPRRDGAIQNGGRLSISRIRMVT
jgi:hypothetical protein